MYDMDGGRCADRVREPMKYRDDHGPCIVPQRHSSLGRWGDKQRAANGQNLQCSVRDIGGHNVDILINNGTRCTFPQLASERNSRAHALLIASTYARYNID